eukprot:scaffold114_cov361-Pinguiococcus_pyrenoidosus.AAC.48
MIRWRRWLRLIGKIGEDHQVNLGRENACLFALSQIWILFQVFLDPEAAAIGTAALRSLPAAPQLSLDSTFFNGTLRHEEDVEDLRGSVPLGLCHRSSE